MAHIERELGGQIRLAARSFPAVVLTGPRRSGKTYLLRHVFRTASYHLLEDPDVIARIRSDPRGWIEEVRTPTILDEIQHVPEILPYVRTLIDQAPSRRGRFLLTGSQDFSLMKGVAESMAGRAAVLQLLPLSCREIGRWD
ncbi:MAG: AAA family ATPase, partial [Acidobacteriota bacterium]